MSTITQQSPPLIPAFRQRSAEPPTSPSLERAANAERSVTDSASAVVRSGAAGGSDAAVLDPSNLTNRIDALLARQVQGGILSGTQANALKGVLGPSREDAGQADPGSKSGLASEARTGAAPSTEDLLASFVKQLQSSQARTEAYGADGSRSGDQSASSLLLNFRV